jgi:hypothetical protein
MSQKGDEKRLERLHKKAARHLLVDPEKMTPHDHKLWKGGTSRLLQELAKPDSETAAAPGSPK